MEVVKKQEERVVIAPDWENMVYAALADPYLATYNIFDVILALTLQLEIIATKIGRIAHRVTSFVVFGGDFAGSRFNRKR